MAAGINPNDIYIRLDEIIAHTLQYLPMKSLHTCARVCKRWSHIVKKLKKMRHRPTWLMYDSKSSSFVNEQIGSKLKEMSSEPRHALVFCSTQLSENGVVVPSRASVASGRPPRSAKMDKLDVIDYLRSVLPSQCRLVSIAADGIVGTSADTGQVTELESSHAFSCLLLPNMDNVDVVSSSVNIQDLYETDDTSPDTKTLLKTLGISDSQTPRLFLLFCTEQVLLKDLDGNPVLHQLLKHYGNIVLAGGLVDDLLSQCDDAAGTEPDMYGIAFCGGDNLQVASVVLDSNICTPADVEATIIQLKRTHIREENSLAFMFSCIGRGEAFYRAPNVDANAFRKVFKTTPLLGFFGNGEIGYNYLPDYTKGSDQNYSVMKQCDMEDGGVDTVLPNVHHSYTTIIAMLSWQPV